MLTALAPYPSSTFRPTSIRCANDRQALFNRIAPVYDNVRCSSPLPRLLLSSSPFFLSFVQLNDLLSLGQHRIWKRMAVSWTGYVFTSFPSKHYYYFLFLISLFLCEFGNRAKTGDRVLDVCCGSGDLAFLLSNNVASHGKVFSQSFSPVNLYFILFFSK